MEISKTDVDRIVKAINDMTGVAGNLANRVVLLRTAMKWSALVGSVSFVCAALAVAGAIYWRI